MLRNVENIFDSYTYLTFDQWEFQDPKMEVLFHMFGHILGGYSLKFRPEK